MRKTLLIPILTFLLMAVAMGFLASTPETTVAESPVVRLGEIAGLTSEPLEPGEAELASLPSDTRFDKRMYREAGGHWYQVSIVFGGRTKNSIHRPELCLPSQGFLMTQPRTVHVGSRSWRFITLDGGVARPSIGFAYTFFNQAGFRTSSHIRRIFQDVWDRTLYNRIDRWVMVTINSSRTDDAGLVRFLEQLEGALK